MFDFDYFLFNDQKSSNSFPKYDLYNDGKATILEVALAGYDKDDLEVYVDDKNYLIIKTNEGYTPDEYPNRKYLYTGLAKRKFNLSFRIKNKYEIQKCEFKDGLLKIVIVQLEEKYKSLQIAID